MVVYNYSGKEINAKIVYYGPALSGKTTNLEWIYSKIPVEYSGKMVSLRTQADRTIFFDFLPLDLGMIDGFRTRFMLYTVPGQVHYNATRKMVLKGVDGLVFVADSEPGRMQDNIESLRNLRDNLQELGMNPDSLPLVLQWNKRDLPNCMDVAELEHELNPHALPSFEACALTGEGVYETLHKTSRLIYSRMTGDQAAVPQSPPVDASLFGESIAQCLQDVDHPEPIPEPVAISASQERTSHSGADAFGAILGGGNPSSVEARPIEEVSVEIPTVPVATPARAMAAEAPAGPAQDGSHPPDGHFPTARSGLVGEVLETLQQKSSEVHSVDQNHPGPGHGQDHETVADRLDSYFQGGPPAGQPAVGGPGGDEPVAPADPGRPGPGRTDEFRIDQDVSAIHEVAASSEHPPVASGSSGASDGFSAGVDLDEMFAEIAATPDSGAQEADAGVGEKLDLITDPLKTEDEARATTQSSSITSVQFSGSAGLSGPVGRPTSRVLEVPVTLDASVLEQGGGVKIVLNLTLK